MQQHLKSIFEKTGVNSRGELVARIYFDSYGLRARDDRERIRTEQSSSLRAQHLRGLGRGQRGGAAAPGA